MSNSVLDNFNLSQFLSTKVFPIDTPNICVCTAPLAATAQRSLFNVVIAGATAVGGGDLTVVVDSTVLRDVESVIIGSAAQTAVEVKIAATNNTFFILAPGLFSLLL
jgi:hypothetical protein